MRALKAIVRVLSKRETKIFFALFVVCAISSMWRIAIAFQENTQIVGVDGGTYREGIVGQPTALNPILATNVVDQDLVALTFTPLSELLDDIQIEENGRVYTLILKENLRWDDKEQFTSDDVVFTIDSIKKLGTLSPLSKSWQNIKAERLSEIKTRIELPNANMFFKDSLEKTYIIPKHIFGKIPPANFHLSTYTLEPVGNGPYRFKSVSKDMDGFIKQYELEKNPLYTGPHTHIQNIVIKFFETQERMEEAFSLKQIQGMGSMTPLKNTELLESRRNKIVAVPMTNYYAIFFNFTRNQVLKNRELREALGLAIQKNELIKRAFNGNATESNSPFPGYGSTDAYDPELARKKIESIQATTGPIEISLSVPDNSAFKIAGDYIKNSWESIGVSRVNILTIPEENVVEKIIDTRDYETILFGNSLENKDDIFSFWHSSQRFYPGLNLSLYENKTVDNLIEQMRQETDESRKEEIRSTIHGFIKSETPAIFLFSLPYTYVLSDLVNGFDMKEMSAPRDRFEQIYDWSVIKARTWKK